MSLMRYLILIIIFYSASSWTDQQDINVGGYHFPPFVEVEDGKPRGLSLGIIKLLNKQQSKYKFHFVLTSPKRRYVDFKRKRFDIILFEHISWGWRKHPIITSLPLLDDGELYITKMHSHKTNSYFNDIRSKRITAMLGYHYGFANNNSSPKYLNEHFSINLVNHFDTMINQVINNKTDIGVITQSYLKYQFLKTPELKKNILISKQFDQRYTHQILLRKNSRISKTELNQLFQQLEDNGKLEALFQQYGLSHSNTQ